MRLIVILTMLALVGCAQDTSSISPNNLQQPSTQDQASQGNGGDVDVAIHYYGGSPTTQPASATGLLNENTKLDGATGSSNFVVVVNAQTGGSSTPSASLTGNNATQASTPTLNPTQRPQAQIDPAIALGAPGSAPNATTNTGGMEASPATQTATNTPNINYTQLIENVKNAVPGAAELLAQLVAKGDPKAIEALNTLGQ